MYIVYCTLNRSKVLLVLRYETKSTSGVQTTKQLALCQWGRIIRIMYKD